MINEIFYDALSGDPTDVFTELFGPPGTNLTGFSLVGVNGNGAADYATVDLSGAVIPADGLLVIATSMAAGATLAARDFVSDRVDWQNGPDAVQLRAADGLVVDALQYGTAAGLSAGEGTPAPDVVAGASLSRNPGHSDTGDNATDFVATDPPTPGTP